MIIRSLISSIILYLWCTFQTLFTKNPLNQTIFKLTEYWSPLKPFNFERKFLWPPWQNMTIIIKDWKWLWETFYLENYLEKNCVEQLKSKQNDIKVLQIFALIIWYVDNASVRKKYYRNINVFLSIQFKPMTRLL